MSTRRQKAGRATGSQGVRAAQAEGAMKNADGPALRIEPEAKGWRVEVGLKGRGLVMARVSCKGLALGAWSIHRLRPHAALQLRVQHTLLGREEPLPCPTHLHLQGLDWAFWRMGWWRETWALPAPWPAPPLPQFLVPKLTVRGPLAPRFWAPLLGTITNLTLKTRVIWGRLRQTPLAGRWLVGPLRVQRMKAPDAKRCLPAVAHAPISMALPEECVSLGQAPPPS